MTDFTEANRQYFDKMATTYKAQFASSLKTVSEQTLKNREWISDQWIDTVNPNQEVRMLEYACGPGIISMTLAPFLTQVIGMDVSGNMIKEFNSNAATLGLADKVIGHECDLLADTPSPDFAGPPYVDLDIVTVSMALHHFEHPFLALQRLGERVKQGGTCFIIDLIPQPDHGHDHGHNHAHKTDFGEASHTVKTHGFSEESMRKLFEEAGFNSEFKYKAIDQPLEFIKDGKPFSIRVFFARAQRA
ncbi:S-adenosyl-L-methionine-dependent methyltransferase [Penicillium malachiteum]|uniref:S-adenosyl-L-methionine-dependent methyltransferase n=1 Tax=Penicillium malachiteum TaxID=1324776 RepID=UPI002548C109|nr:S-adenosyl-L-methionine-dependent methyltransferase [Penicillium malachiteum]KAJ5730711.1 S-adenosyl-L-methionine-dependent methyltransferase [Penicillium malachiteum]